MCNSSQSRQRRATLSCMTSGVGATTEADVIRFIGSPAWRISYGSCNRQRDLRDAVKRATVGFRGRPLPSHHQMHRRLGEHALLHAVAQRGKVDAGQKGSPRPSTTGEIATCISSISPACRYWRIVAAPPPRRTSLPAAASRARPAPPRCRRSRSGRRCRPPSPAAGARGA